DVLNPNPHRGFGPVAALGLVGQRLAPLALAVDVAFQLPVAQALLHKSLSGRASPFPRRT
ncbi:MAG: hypothetical protein ACI9TZ_002910, partial [Yoonia sp.]